MICSILHPSRLRQSDVIQGFGVNHGRHAVINKTRWAIGATTALAIAALASTAMAQTTTAPAPATPAPAAKAPAVKKAPAKKAEAPAKQTPAKTEPAKTAKPATKATSGAVVCKGMAETACVAQAESCSWVVPTKANKATGKVQSAYCKSKPKPKAAKAAKAAAPAKAAPAEPAPKAAKK
jgi:hypothetical protein